MVMSVRSFTRATEFKHIERFREAGIRTYEGPNTCLQCHDTMKIHTKDGVREVDPLEDIVNSTHFMFQQSVGGF